MSPARRVFDEGPGEDEDSSSNESSYDLVESVSTVMRSVIQKRGKRRSKKQTFEKEPMFLIERLPQTIHDEPSPNDSSSSFANYDFDPMPEPSSLMDPFEDDDSGGEDDVDDDDILPSFGPSLTLDDDDDTDLASSNIVDLAQLETEKVRVSTSKIGCSKC